MYVFIVLYNLPGLVVPLALAKLANGYKLFHLGSDSLLGVAIFITAQCVKPSPSASFCHCNILKDGYNFCFSFGSLRIHVRIHYVVHLYLLVCSPGPRLWSWSSNRHKEGRKGQRHSSQRRHHVEVVHSKVNLFGAAVLHQCLQSHTD